MKEVRKVNIAFVLGMFETGLGVGRSLGREGVKVFGFDFRKDIGFYSKYIKPSICPHPINEDSALMKFLTMHSLRQDLKPVLFVTSDDFLVFVSRNFKLLSNYFLFNFSEPELIEEISNKFSQYTLAKRAGINLPSTYKIESITDLNKMKGPIKYPVIIKALDVNDWRGKIGPSKKGFKVTNLEELLQLATFLLEKDLSLIIQEIIPGPDNCHFKYCGYIGRDGQVLLEFTLKKIRQYPIRFGVGVVVESVQNEALVNEGRKLFKEIGYRGVGSAEFKLDERDGLLKLIELNPRYWQQNSLPTACGMNFPMTDYKEVTDQSPDTLTNFTIGVKWVNRYSDFSSFIDYFKEGNLTFCSWRRSLRGRKIFSDFAWDDPIPFLYELRFGLKLFRLPRFLINKITQQ